MTARHSFAHAVAHAAVVSKRWLQTDVSSMSGALVGGARRRAPDVRADAPADATHQWQALHRRRHGAKRHVRLPMVRCVVYIFCGAVCAWCGHVRWTEGASCQWYGLPVCIMSAACSNAGCHTAWSEAACASFCGAMSGGCGVRVAGLCGRAGGTMASPVRSAVMSASTKQCTLFGACSQSGRQGRAHPARCARQRTEAHSSRRVRVTMSACRALAPPARHLAPLARFAC